MSDIQHLSLIANRIRQHIIQMLVAAGSGHSAGSLGMADVFTVLYCSELLELKPDQPLWPERDRVVLSAGHIVPVWYATLAEAGYFPIQELDTLRTLASRLQGHPHLDFLDPHHNLPGIENTAGPLGQGVSQAVGLALGLRLLHQSGKLTRLPRVICISSDGEQQEGQVYEAYMAAAKYKLDHLTIIIDRNHIQISGTTEQVMPIEPLRAKLESFNLAVFEVDGHNHQSIIDALRFDQSLQSKPVVIIAHTIPGKGVSYMEQQVSWHGKPPSNIEETAIALKELRSMQGKIEVGEYV